MASLTQCATVPPAPYASHLGLTRHQNERGKKNGGSLAAERSEEGRIDAAPPTVWAASSNGRCSVSSLLATGLGAAPSPARGDAETVQVTLWSRFSAVRAEPGRAATPKWGDPPHQMPVKGAPIVRRNFVRVAHRTGKEMPTWRRVGKSCDHQGGLPLLPVEHRCLQKTELQPTKTHTTHGRGGL